MGVMADKDRSHMLERLAPLAAFAVTVRYDIDRALSAEAARAGEVGAEGPGARAGQEERAAAMELIDKTKPFKAYGFDIDTLAVDLTIDNAKKAGVGSKILVSEQDIKDFKPQRGAVTVCNPPYGERLLDLRQAEELYKVLGDKLSPDKESPCYIITPHEEFEKFFGKKADKKRKLYNGMIKCNLYMYFK